jgi:dTDP-4-amino-4,6-dideoxygalactose transaminase
LNIPFVDLHAQYKTIKSEIDDAIASVIRESAFIGGKHVKVFEQAFAEMYGVKHCIAVGNGTDAIYITLKMMGVGPGDEVITTALSWISTSEVISQTGAKVVFADIEDDYYTIDPVDLEKKITPRTKAIIPVHIYGQAANMGEIMRVAKEHNIRVIEDCAQAHFGQWEGLNLGTFGAAATFSFFPGKNLGAYGDAGGIITNDDELAQKFRMFANHGALIKHQHQIEGINSRMDGIQAAILKVKLKHILKWTEERIVNANRYLELLSGIASLITPSVRDNTRHVFHLFVIQVEDREAVKYGLEKIGISTGIHYPTALPFLPAYSHLSHKPDDFPNAHAFTKSNLSIPIYPELQSEDIVRICQVLHNLT